MIGFMDTEPLTQGSTEYSGTFADKMAAEWRMGADNSVTQSLKDIADVAMMRRSAAQAGISKMSVEDLNTQFEPLPGLKFTEPEYESVARLRHLRQQELLRNLYYTDSIKQWGILPKISSLTSVAGFGVNMLGSLLQPVDLGMLAVPVVGEVGKAEEIAAAAARVGATRSALTEFRVQMAKGLVEKSSIPFVERFPRLAPWVAENLTQQTAMEAVRVTKELQQTGETDTAQILKDITGGMIVGSILHKAIEGAGKLSLFALRRLSPETTSSMVEKGVADLIEGRKVDVSENIRQDPNVIRNGIVVDKVNRVSDELLATQRSMLERQIKFTEVTDAMLEREIQNLKDEGRIGAASKEEVARVARDNIRDQLVRQYADALALEAVTGEAHDRVSMTEPEIVAEAASRLSQGEDHPVRMALDKYVNGGKTAADTHALASALGVAYKPFKGKVKSLSDLPDSRVLEHTQFMETLRRAKTEGLDRLVNDELERRVVDHVNRERAKWQAELQVNGKLADFEAKRAQAQKRLEHLRADLKKMGADRPPVGLEDPKTVEKLVPKAEPKSTEVAALDERLQAKNAELEALGDLTDSEKEFLETKSEADQRAEMVNDKAVEVINAIAGCMNANGE